MTTKIPRYRSESSLRRDELECTKRKIRNDWRQRLFMPVLELRYLIYGNKFRLINKFYLKSSKKVGEKSVSLFKDLTSQ